jgi:hypothetical protein
VIYSQLMRPPEGPGWYHDSYGSAEGGDRPRVGQPPHQYQPPTPRPGRTAPRWRNALIVAAVILSVVGSAYGLRAVVAGGMKDAAIRWDAARFGQARGDTLPFECVAVRSYVAAHPPIQSPSHSDRDPYGHGAQISRFISIEDVYVDPGLTGGIVVYSDHSDYAVAGQTVTYAEVLVVKEDGQWKACGFQVDGNKQKLLNGQTVLLGWRLGGSTGSLFGRG